jgi:hypothetical protein
VVDQHPQSTPPAGMAEAFVQAAAALAESIRDLASAVRETAAFAQLEVFECEDGDCAGESEAEPAPGVGTGGDPGMDDCERLRSRDSVVLPLVSVQDRADQEPDAGALCRPGGCSCAEPDSGRHARREDNVASVGHGVSVGARSAECCQGAGAGVR